MTPSRARIEALALRLWRDREARFPPRVRRWTPDEWDRASGAWAAVLAQATRRLTRPGRRA